MIIRGVRVECFQACDWSVAPNTALSLVETVNSHTPTNHILYLKKCCAWTNTAVGSDIISKKISKLYIGFYDLSQLDWGLIAKAVMMLIILSVEHTKLTNEQYEGILHGLSEGS